MPYIKQEDRDRLDHAIDELKGKFRSVGEVNYAITRLIDSPREPGEPLSYAAYNAMIGVLECAKLELYRRRVSEYEDRKIAENGDLRL